MCHSDGYLVMIRLLLASPFLQQHLVFEGVDTSSLRGLCLGTLSSISGHYYRTSGPGQKLPRTKGRR